MDGYTEILGMEGRRSALIKLIAQMKTIVSFVAYRRSALKTAGVSSQHSVSCELSDDAFEKLDQIIQTKNERSIDIALDENSCEYQKVIDLIYSDINKRPSKFVGLGVRRGKEFLVNRRNYYTDAEIAQAPALLVTPSPNLVNITDIENGVPTYRSNDVRKKEFGALFPSWRMAVTGGMADFLKTKNLIGLNLVAMKHVGKSMVTTSIHWIKPTVRLPRSILKLCDNRGNLLTDATGWHQIIASSTPLELVYDYDEFTRVGDFDLASTYESPGSGVLIATEMLVVSQNFRILLETRGCNGVEFTPVRLV